MSFYEQLLLIDIKELFAHEARDIIKECISFCKSNESDYKKFQVMKRVKEMVKHLEDPSTYEDIEEMLDCITTGMRSNRKENERPKGSE